MKEENIFNLIKGKISKVELSNEEKGLLRSNISEKLIENIPVRYSAPVPSPYVASNIVPLLIYKNLNKKNMLIGALIAAILSGSVSFAAEKALPGDALYAIKVNVNEEVRDLLATTAESQAKWDTTKIERRLNEAKALQQEGKLDTEKKDLLKSEVASHIQSLKEELVNVEKSGNTEEVKDIKNNLGSLVSAERLSLPVGEGVGQTTDNSTSTVTTASGTVIVSNITASSTKGRGDDDGDSEDEFDDFVKTLKDTVTNVSDHDSDNENGNDGDKNKKEDEKSREEAKQNSERNREEIKNKTEDLKQQAEKSREESKNKLEDND